MKKHFTQLLIVSASCFIFSATTFAQESPPKENPIPDTTKLPDTTKIPDTTNIPDSTKKTPPPAKVIALSQKYADGHTANYTNLNVAIKEDLEQSDRKYKNIATTES